MKRVDCTGLWWWMGLFLFVFLAVVGVPADAQQAPTSPGSPHAPSPAKPPKLPTTLDVIESESVALDLSVDGNQTVGGGIVATFAVMAHRSLENVQIELVLPEGIRKTAGEPTWQGSMAAGEVRIVELSAELSAPGLKRIVGRVTLPPAAAGGAPQVLTADREWEVEKAAPAKPHK
jgi:hypothetical protein